MKIIKLVLCFLFFNTSAFAIATFIDKNVNVNLEVGQYKTYFPTTAAGADSYSPSSVHASVQTSIGLTNPSITNRIIKVTTGQELGGQNRSTVRIQAVGVGECRVVCSFSYNVPLGSTMGIANVIYHVKVTEKTVYVSSISLNKNILNMSAGDTEMLYSSVLPSNASNTTLSWSSSNNNIATVNSNGLVTAISNGNAIISVKSTDGSNVSAECSINVFTPVSSIILSHDFLSLKVGESSNITSVVLPTSATNPKLQWISSNPNIVIVDDAGNITAKTPGECIVIATSTDGSNISASCSVIVTQKIENVTLDNYSLSLFEGESKSLTATIYPSDATSIIEWYSSNTDICTVDANGLISAVSKGEATVVAKCSSDPSIFAVCNIVVNRHVDGIVLSNSEITLFVDTNKQLYATVYPESANNKKVIWLSENPSVASVNEYGLVSANSCGKTIIKAISMDRPELSASCTVTVEALISNLILNLSNATLSEGETTQITVSVFPESANNKTLKWSSSNEAVATVDQDGKITAVAKGTAIITAKTTDGSNISATCKITVIKLVSSIDISHKSLCLEVGNTEIISASAIPSDATNIMLRWYSENENIATVDNGVICAIREGKTNVVVETTDGSNIKDTCEVWVTTPTSISKINYDEANIHVENSTIYISNVPSSNFIYIFNSDGLLVYKGIFCKDTIEYKPPVKGVYIVVLQSKTYKLAVF